MSTTPNKITQRFAQMEQDRQELLERLAPLDTQRLESKPDPGSWSVTEVIHHLTVAEEAALHYMQKKLKAGGHQKAPAKAKLKQLLLNLAIKLPIKYKAPKVAQLPEGVTISFAEAVESWNRVRNELEAVYTNLDPELADHDLFKHPMVGKLSVMQSIIFMHGHMTRHEGQIDRILSEV